jgi:hypothetical protein
VVGEAVGAAGHAEEQFGVDGLVGWIERLVGMLSEVVVKVSGSAEQDLGPVDGWSLSVTQHSRELTDLGPSRCSGITRHV